MDKITEKPGQDHFKSNYKRNGRAILLVITGEIPFDQFRTSIITLFHSEGTTLVILSDVTFSIYLFTLVLFTVNILYMKEIVGGGENEWKHFLFYGNRKLSGCS